MCTPYQNGKKEGVNTPNLFIRIREVGSMQNQLTISTETLEAFLTYMSESGHSINSVQTYRQTVTQFYDFLPEEKVIGPDTVSQWQKYMIEQGYANTTNNARLYIINHFMEFLGKREWQHKCWTRKN